MAIYYAMVESWIIGVVLLAAFLLTFWPGRRRMLVAACCMSVAIIGDSLFNGYWTFLRAAMEVAMADGSGARFPMLQSFILPLLSVLVAVTATVMLFPWVKRERALFAGRILFLVVYPCVLFVSAYFRQPAGYLFFPLGLGALAYPLLWFRIREQMMVCQ